MDRNPKWLVGAVLGWDGPAWADSVVVEVRGAEWAQHGLVVRWGLAQDHEVEVLAAGLGPPAIGGLCLAMIAADEPVAAVDRALVVRVVAWERLREGAVLAHLVRRVLAGAKWPGIVAGMISVVRTLAVRMDSAIRELAADSVDRVVPAEAMASIARGAFQVLSVAAAILARAMTVGRAVGRWASALLVEWDRIVPALVTSVARVAIEVLAVVAAYPARAASVANRSATNDRVKMVLLRPMALDRRRLSRLL